MAMQQRGGMSGPAGPTGSPQAPQTMWQPAGSGGFWITFLVLLLFNYFLINWLFPSQPNFVTIPYTSFKEQVEAGNVLAITSRGEDIQGDFRTPVIVSEQDGGMMTISPAP